ncbi:MAG: alpha/beta hydrolase [Gammaproteobacteria bacterium]|nr:alpha/beta hydrolase [Gammaproteobacteria bacterium]
MNFIQKIVIFSLLIISHTIYADYGYPIKNPIAATVVGTPEALRITQADLQDRQPDYVKMPALNTQFKRTIDKEYKISIFPNRIIPDVFWYEKGGLKYSIAEHKTQAPLMFIIAGTGASYNSVTVKNLQKTFYQVGYHVVAISSPTIPNFMYNASRTVIPGNLLEDSEDIYHVMQRIMEKHNDIPVSDYFLTGYSLGASHAAFVTRIDDQRKSNQKDSFQFKKTLLINPPLNLVTSVDVLDKMFEENIPGGIDHFHEFFERFINKASTFYRENEELGVGKEFFYEILKEQPPSEEEMKVMIGFVFRISSTGMIFGADVFNRQGYIVPKNKVDKLTPSSSLTHYSKVAHRLGFNDYIKHFYLPTFEKKRGVSVEELIEQASLESIETYLKGNGKIALMHNMDDPILLPGEIDTLKSLFPGRTMIYPYGGHMGNLQYKKNVIDMINYFDDKKIFNKDDVVSLVTGEMQ